MLVGQAAGVNLEPRRRANISRRPSGISTRAPAFVVRRLAAYYCDARAAVAGERPDDANRARLQAVEDVARDAINGLIDGEDARPVGGGGGEDYPSAGVEAHRGGARPLPLIFPRLELPSFAGAVGGVRVSQCADT